MSDDLVKRLRDLHKQATVERSHFYVGKCVADAIHRIEELEAKLAKAVEMLAAIIDDNDNGMFVQDHTIEIARATLAELKGYKT